MSLHVIHSSNFKQFPLTYLQINKQTLKIPVYQPLIYVNCHLDRYIHQACDNNVDNMMVCDLDVIQSGFILNLSAWPD